MARNIIEVLDRIMEIVPGDCAHDLDKVRSSAMFTAPELMYTRWQKAAAILTKHEHTFTEDQLTRAIAIFGGTE